jgi:Flp pilus assembly protein TadG
MKGRLQIASILRDQQGATAILIAVAFTVLLGFLALAIDMGYLWVAQNELQNAADAGSLAGARFLTNQDGSINTNANQLAYNAATSNKSTNIPAEVNWSGGNSGDVQRGHWSFATRTFTPNANTVQTNLWFRSKDDLDADVDFINAIRVTTRRQAQPVRMFVAGILGHNSIEVVTDAVAYIGFTGDMTVSEVDQPIAICAQSITNEYGAPNCDIGRMINSGNDDLSDYQSGGWTNFDQESPCLGGTNANEVNGLVCNTSGQTQILEVFQNVGTQGGQIQSAFSSLYDCWQEYLNTEGYVPWRLHLPVVTCPDRNVGVCEEVVGMVTVDVVHITGPGTDPDYINAPEQMDTWSCDADPNCSSLPPGPAKGQCCWDSFVGHFALENLDGSPVPYSKKNVYFKPTCDAQLPAGNSGGENFGVLAKIPVLVE